MTLHQKLRRTFASATLLVAAAAIGFVAPANAEVRVSLKLPDATMKARSISTEDLRKNGLMVRMEGQGDAKLVVFAYEIKNGEIGRPWNSRPLPKIEGSRLVSGNTYFPEYPNTWVPGDIFIRGDTFFSGDTFLTADSVRGFLRDVKMPPGTTGVLLVVSSTDTKTARGVQTKALFAMGQPMLD